MKTTTTLKTRTALSSRRALETGLQFLALATIAVLLASMPAKADIFNGDFENGGTDWNFNGPADWDNVFPPAGGNPDGYAVIASPDPGSSGIGCLIQTFPCGEPGSDTVCSITFDYWLAPDNGTDPTSGIIKVFVDGAELYSAAGPSDGWQTGTMTVPCGVHVIELCLEVTAPDNAWRCCFDNVQAVCDDTVSADADTWTGVKGLFR